MYPHDSSSTLLQSSNLKIIRAVKALMLAGLGFLLAGFASISQAMYFPTAEFVSEFAQRGATQEAILELPKLAPVYSEYGYQWVGDYRQCEVEDWSQFTAFEDAKGLKFEKIQTETDGTSTYRVILTDKRRAGQRLCIGMRGSQGGVTTFTDPIRWGLRLAEAEDQSTETSTNTTEETEHGTQDAQDNSETTTEGSDTSSDATTTDQPEASTGSETDETSSSDGQPANANSTTDTEDNKDTTTTDTNDPNTSAPALSGDLTSGQSGQPIAGLSGDDLIQLAPELAGLSVRSVGDNLNGNLTLDIYMVTGANNARRDPATAFVGETINSYLHIGPSGKDFVMYDARVKVTFPKAYVGSYPQEGSTRVPIFADSELATKFTITEDNKNWYFEYTIPELKGGISTDIPFSFRMQSYVTPKDYQTTIKVEVIDSQKVTKYQHSHIYTAKVNIPEFGFGLPVVNQSNDFMFAPDPFLHPSARYFFSRNNVLFPLTYTNAKTLSGVLVGYQKFDLPVNYYGSGSLPTMTNYQYTVGYSIQIVNGSISTNTNSNFGMYLPKNTEIKIQLPAGAVFDLRKQAMGYYTEYYEWKYDASSHSLIAQFKPGKDESVFRSLHFVLSYPNQPIDQRQEPVASVILAKGTPDEVNLGTQKVSTKWTLIPTTIGHTGHLIKTTRHLFKPGTYTAGLWYKQAEVMFDKTKQSHEYDDKSSFLLLGYHKSTDVAANTDGMKITQLIDYDLDPSLYYGKLFFRGFGSMDAHGDIAFWRLTSGNRAAVPMTIYGIKADGSKDLLGSNLAPGGSIDIMDKQDQYDKLQILFDTPLMIKDEAVVFRVHTYVKDTIRDTWKTTLTGSSPGLPNSFSGYYTLPGNPTTQIASNDASLSYVQPYILISEGVLYHTTYNHIFGSNNNTLTLRLLSVYDAGEFSSQTLDMMSGTVFHQLILLPNGMIPTGYCMGDTDIKYNPDILVDNTVIRNYKNTNKTAHILTYKKGKTNNVFICTYTITNEMTIGANLLESYTYWEKLPYPYGVARNHYIDALDLDNDGNTTEQFIKSTGIINFNAARELILKNSVADTTSSTGVFLSVSPVENKSEFYYKMNLYNNAPVAAQGLTIYNVLPAIGDHTIVADKDGSYPARGSAFPVNLVRSLESVPENASLLTQWDVYYSTDDQPQTTAQMANVSWKRADQITDFSAVKMIKIVQKPGSKLDTNAQANFYLHSRIPDGLNQPDMSTAVGSSAFSTNGAQFYEGNRVTLQLVNNYRLDGKVFDDVSGSGSLVGAIPLQGYTVTLYSGDTVVMHNGQAIATQTDQHGNYMLTIPKKGTYTVRVEDIGRHTTGTVLFTNQYGAYVAGSGNDATRIGATMMYVSTPFTVDGYNVSNPARPFDKPSSMIATRNIGFRHSSTPFAIFKHEANHLTRGLSGAVFQVIDQDGVIVDTMTTSETGYAISKPILHGNYTLKELTAPIGYAVSRDNPTITIPYQGMYYIANTKLVTNITICAIDTETNQPILTPVAFDFAHHQGLTTVDGCVTAPDVPYGNPTLTGTTPPYGYTGSVITGVTVDGNTPTVNVPFTPIRVPFGFMKLDATNADKTLEGAVFHVTDANGQLVDTITTSHTGYGVSIPLRYGRYKLKEITPPTDYALVDTEFDIEIPTSTLNLATIVNHPLTGSLIFTKVDHRDQTKKLSGAIFAIQTMTGHELIRVMTDAQGSASVSGLIYGNYRVVEVEAPHHYIPASGFDITINRNTQPYTFLVPNEKKQGKVKVTKVDQRSDKWFLPGAVFELRDKETNTLVDTVTTNASGFVFSKPLPYGHYEIVETKAPKDYDLTFTGATIVIEHPDQEITISNRVTWKDGVPFTPPSPKPSVPSTGTVTTPVITGSIVPPSTGTVRPPLTGLILPPYTGTILPPLDIPTKPDKTHDAAPDQPTPPKKPTPIKTYVPKLPKTGALETDEIALIRVVRVPHRKLVVRDSLFMVGS